MNTTVASSAFLLWWGKPVKGAPNIAKKGANRQYILAPLQKGAAPFSYLVYSARLTGLYITNPMVFQSACKHTRRETVTSRPVICHTQV